MTTLLNRPDVTTPAEPRRTPHRLLAVLPWVLVAALLAGAWHRADVPDLQILRYGLYLLVGVVLPGTLVHRALRGSRGNLPEDLGYGAATGLLVQLAGWALAAATGLQVLLPYWPLLVLAVFLAVPALRRHWRIAEPQPLPVAWSWLICGALVLVIAFGAVAWRTNPLPPADTMYYQDLLYHLALVHEMTRSMPFEVPQLAGDPLRYHYLSDADMAIGSMSTGIPPATVLLRLWMIPIGAVAVLVIAALTRELSGKWWAGPLAGAAAFAGLPLVLGAPVSPNGGSSLSFASPSQTYAMPLLGLLVAIAADVVRGRPLGRAWLLVPPLALACAGAKSSALPPLVAGLALTVLVVWWQNRRFPRVIAGFSGVVVVGMLIGAQLFAGGGAGTLGVQPLSLLRWMEPYRSTLGENDGIVPGGLLPPGVQGAGLTGVVFIAGLVAWWLLMQAPRLLGVLALRRRSDPAAWLLGGMVVAGFGAALLLWHPSASQYYFLLCAGPLGVVLTVWMLAERVRTWWVPVAGLAAGALWAVMAPDVAEPVKDTYRGWAWALGLPVVRALGFVVVAAVLLLVLRRRLRVLLVAVPAAVLGASIAIGAVGSVSGLTAPKAGQPTTARMLTQEEMRAALWLEEHSDNHDVVATNVHCFPMARYKPCDARAFWVAGLGGRRTLVESWGYSDKTVAANGVGGLGYMLQPPPDPQRYALNQRVFATADPADLTRLRQEYGVTWLLADTRAGAVAPGLAKLAQVRYSAGPVTVYELR